jgi:putative Mn2+ efflux pump MntP
MGGILILLSFLVGLTALILGIVATSMSNRNPAISKAKAIVGLCFGALPLLLMLIGLIAGSPFRRF